ncbi:YraN family protein [bacterium]|nr:YraN family protein [bacterium]
MDNKKLGNAGEDLACRYLIRNGYEIVERNKSYPKICEIDIIAKRKDKFYFVEVKTRSTDAYGDAKDAVDKNKLSHIRKGAVLYLENNKSKNFQIDVIAITLKPELRLEHFRNIG